jgi:hypothetical protein
VFACVVPRLLNGWGVHGRRSNRRFSFTEPKNCVLRVLSDVIVQRTPDDEWIAIGRQPAVAGETVVLDIVEGERRQQLTACVIESRPIVLEGDMRHRIRLQSDDVPRILFEQQVRRG